MMVWITDEEYEAVHRRKAKARHDYIMRLVRLKHLNAYAIGKGTGISASVVRRFLRGEGEPSWATYDKVRLFVERYQRPKKR